MPKKTRPSRFRLDPAVRPREYTLDLEPDLEAGRFRGEVAIDLEIDKPRREITLHAAGLTVGHAVLTTEGTSHELRVRPRSADEAVTLALRKPVRGAAELALSFSGALGTHLRGF